MKIKVKFGQIQYMLMAQQNLVNLLSCSHVKFPQYHIIVSDNHRRAHHLLCVVSARSFRPRQEFPEHDGTSHGNPDDSPADSHRTVLRVGGCL